MVSKKDIERLASVSQIRVSSDQEFEFYLKSFRVVENMLNEFEKIQFKSGVSPMLKIIDYGLTFEDLDFVYNAYVPHKLTDKDLRKNSFMRESRFVFKKQ